MHTVLSAFDDAGQARHARDELVKEGYPPENVHVQGAQDAGAAVDAISERALASPEREIAVGPHALSAMSDFFDRLLGREHAHHARTWSEAVRRGSAVVVVDTVSETSAERAATVLREQGACDIVERAEQWSRDGWTATGAGEQQLADGSVVRWRTAHILHRRAGPALSELVGGRDRAAS